MAQIGLQVEVSMDELADQPKVTFEPDGSVTVDTDGSGRVELWFYSERHFERWLGTLAEVAIRRNGGRPIFERHEAAPEDLGVHRVGEGIDLPHAG